jgi:hypothetical protein
VDLGHVVVGYQRWDELLFLHWSVQAPALRPLVDPRLELDLHEGRAYVSVTPFTVRGARLRGLPRLPLVTQFDEVNLRTYVRAPGGLPGVWFFSLDAASGAASALARLALGLPYRRAEITRRAVGERHEYRSVRRWAGAPAELDVAWGVAGEASAAPGSLSRFLCERYALYTSHAGLLLRVRVRHAPWSLREVTLERLAETLTTAAGVVVPPEPLLAQFSEGVDVEFFPPERVG